METNMITMKTYQTRIIPYLRIQNKVSGHNFLKYIFLLWGRVSNLIEKLLMFYLFIAVTELKYFFYVSCKTESLTLF